MSDETRAPTCSLSGNYVSARRRRTIMMPTLCGLYGFRGGPAKYFADLAVYKQHSQKHQRESAVYHHETEGERPAADGVDAISEFAPIRPVEFVHDQVDGHTQTHDREG